MSSTQVEVTICWKRRVCHKTATQQTTVDASPPYLQIIIQVTFLWGRKWKLTKGLNQSSYLFNVMHQYGLLNWWVALFHHRLIFMNTKTHQTLVISFKKSQHDMGLILWVYNGFEHTGEGLGSWYGCVRKSVWFHPFQCKINISCVYIYILLFIKSLTLGSWKIKGNNLGKRVFIPRIIMSPSKTDWPFVLHRR